MTPPPRSGLTRVLTPWRLRAWPTAVLIGVGAVFLLQLVAADGARTVGGRLGGDLPAFVGAARVLRAGGALYDPEAQRLAQADLLPDGQLCWFAWPPLVAALYVPLSFLPWPLAVGVHSALTTLAAGVAVRAWARRLALPVGVALPAALSFYPLLRSLPGGQLTAVLLLGLVLPGLGGLVVAKPQLGVLPLLVAGRWGALGTGSLAVWAGSALVDGVDWPVRWLPAALGFARAARADPGSVALWDHPLPGVGITILAACAWTVRRDPERRVALAVTAAPLLAPHALWYDVGLLVLPLGLIAARGRTRALPGLLLVWALGLGMMVWPGPLGVVTLLTTALLLAR